MEVAKYHYAGQQQDLKSFHMKSCQPEVMLPIFTLPNRRNSFKKMVKRHHALRAMMSRGGDGTQGYQEYASPTDVATRLGIPSVYRGVPDRQRSMVILSRTTEAEGSETPETSRGETSSQDDIFEMKPPATGVKQALDLGYTERSRGIQQYS